MGNTKKISIIFSLLYQYGQYILKKIGLLMQNLELFIQEFYFSPSRIIPIFMIVFSPMAYLRN
jgi:hypothetical protein